MYTQFLRKKIVVHVILKKVMPIAITHTPPRKLDGAPLDLWITWP